MIDFTFISLYEREISTFFERGILKKAIDNQYINSTYINLRNYAEHPHYKVDDYPYSNKQGLILKYDVMKLALMESANNAVIIYPDPKGVSFTYKQAKLLSLESKITFLSGAFEGVDERIFSEFNIQRYSIGDFVIPNGDSAAIVMAEAIARNVPGVVGCSDCVLDDSIVSGLLEFPQFTAPRQVDGHIVPEVLYSGNHSMVDDWRQREQLKLTLLKRPDLINLFNFNEKLVTIMDQVIMEDLV